MSKRGRIVETDAARGIYLQEIIGETTGKRFRREQVPRSAYLKQQGISSKATNLTWNLAQVDHARQMSKRRRVNGGGRVYGGVPAARSRALMSYLPETKYFDTACDGHTMATAADWTGTEVPMDVFIAGDGSTVSAYTDSALIPSAQGTGYGQLLGTRYHLKSIRIKGAINAKVQSDQADVARGAIVRLVLVMDTNANGAQAQGESVFTDFGSDSINCNSFLNMGTTGGKFRVLRDMRVMLQPAVAGTDGASTNSIVRQSSLFHMQWKPKKPLVCSLKASAGTPATSQLQSHNIFLLALTDSGAGATLDFACRAYYCD